MLFRSPSLSDVRRTAEREGVQVREYDVIYKLFDDIDALIKGLIEPEETENILGHLEIKAVFDEEVRADRRRKGSGRFDKKAGLQAFKGRQGRGNRKDFVAKARG